MGRVGVTKSPLTPSLYRRKNLLLLAGRLAPHGFQKTPEDQCTVNSGFCQLIRAGIYIFKCFLSMEFWRGIFFKLGSKLFYHPLRRSELSAPEMPPDNASLWSREDLSFFGHHFKPFTYLVDNCSTNSLRLLPSISVRAKASLVYKLIEILKRNFCNRTLKTAAARNSINKIKIILQNPMAIVRDEIIGFIYIIKRAWSL